MKSGIIVVNKEEGYTSFDVVARLRGILHIKKIGHTGTLDPNACGVLPIVIGKATKAVDYIEDHNKTYIAKLVLGKTTDTYDIDGQVIAESDLFVSRDMFEQKLFKFKGKQKQIPPMYSAKKVDGKKLYELAREGKVVERKPCDIEIFDLQVVSFDYPNASICVSCSKGTYIRSLIHDLGQNLGCGACMTGLLRTKACGFTIGQSFLLDEIEALRDENRIDEIIHPLDELFSFEKRNCLPDADVLLENGNKIPVSMVKGDDVFEGQTVCFYDSKGRFVGLYQKQGICYKPKKIFLE